MTTKTHVCLVSAQATPNLTPALDADIRPERVVLLVSPDMSRRADWLEQVLRPRGIRVARWHLDDPWDLEHIQTRVLELIDRFAAEGLLEARSGRLRFRDEEARFYGNGGWLEEHVYDLLRSLRRELPQVQDLARSLNIVREQRGDEVPNELDVACLAENRLYILECKTRAWRREGPGTDALYRLDVLRDRLGGLQARAMLVSYRDLPAYDLRRAADLWIEVCAGRRLTELAAVLRRWLGNRTD